MSKRNGFLLSGWLARALSKHTEACKKELTDTFNDAVAIAALDAKRSAEAFAEAMGVLSKQDEPTVNKEIRERLAELSKFDPSTVLTFAKEDEVSNRFNTALNVFNSMRAVNSPAEQAQEAALCSMEGDFEKGVLRNFFNRHDPDTTDNAFFNNSACVPLFMEFYTEKVKQYCQECVDKLIQQMGDSGQSFSTDEPLPSWQDVKEPYGEKPAPVDSLLPFATAVSEMMDAGRDDGHDALRAMAEADEEVFFGDEPCTKDEAEEDTSESAQSNSVPAQILIPARERLTLAINLYNCAISNDAGLHTAIEAALSLFKVRFELITAIYFFDKFGGSGEIRGFATQYKVWEEEINEQYRRRELVRCEGDAEIQLHVEALSKAVNEWAIKMHDVLVGTYDVRTTGLHCDDDKTLARTILYQEPVVHSSIRKSFAVFINDLTERFPKNF